MCERVAKLSLHLPVRAAQPCWQRALHRSVRLYLALGEVGADVPRLEAGLRLLEGALLAYLLGPELHPTAEASAAARALLEWAQAACLADAPLVEHLLTQEPRLAPSWLSDWDTVQQVRALMAA